MPDVQEVFRMATQKGRPDPGALERQHGQQRQRTIRRKMGVYGLVAALGVVIAVLVGRSAVDSGEQVPGAQLPSPTTAPEATTPFATVTYDGSTCSWERTADSTDAGVVYFELVNSTEERAMFDSWRLEDGYPFSAFVEAVQRDRRRAEEGKPGWGFPYGGEATYLQSDVIPANSSEIIPITMSPGRHAIECLERQEDAIRGGKSRAFGAVGPIVAE